MNCFTVVVPKGRLYEGSRTAVKDLFNVDIGPERRKYDETIGNLRVLKFKARDCPKIAGMIGYGCYAITGFDIANENTYKIPFYMRHERLGFRIMQGLGFGKSELWLMGKKDSLMDYFPYTNSDKDDDQPEFYPVKQQRTDKVSIATRFPSTTKDFLFSKGIKPSMIQINGRTSEGGAIEDPIEIESSLEALPGILFGYTKNKPSIADIIVDTVESGLTAELNGLKKMEKIMNSEAVLIRVESFK